MQPTHDSPRNALGSPNFCGTRHGFAGLIAALTILCLPALPMSAIAAAPSQDSRFQLGTSLQHDLTVPSMLDQLFEDGLAAFKAGDLDVAIRTWRSAGEQGHIESQFNLGLIYLKGYGVAKDPVEAAIWWTMAAILGDATAQYNLGLMYAQGNGVQQNLQDAAHWWQLAANQGFPDAIKAMEMLRARDELAKGMRDLRDSLSKN